MEGSTDLTSAEKALCGPYLAACARVVKRGGAEALFVQAKQVQELIDSPGWAVLEELLQTVGQSNQDRMVTGVTLDHATYARMAGAIGAVRGAVLAPKAVLLAAERVERKLEILDPQTADGEGA